MERVLVVDDDESIRSFLVEVLDRLGYESDTAENGKKGLEKYHTGSYTLIITDMRMPIMDGLTMLKTIRSEGSKIPIIVVTAFPTVNSAVESLIHGADYYLVKPINLDDLKAKIGKAIERRKIHKRLASTKVANIVMVGLIPLWIILGWLLARLFK
jgi:DNA-binding response OmpR family regulator